MDDHELESRLEGTIRNSHELIEQSRDSFKKRNNSCKDAVNHSLPRNCP
jgi:hypothetical protein